MLKRAKKAFTLIEVLAATAILGISLAVLLASMSNVTIGADQLSLRTDVVRAMFNAADLYRLQPLSRTPTLIGGTFNWIANAGNTASTATPWIASIAGNRWLIKADIAGFANPEVQLVSVSEVNLGSAPYRKHVLTFRYQDTDQTPREKSLAVVVK
jgi:prepilin-type N-terminal cleavage/methylation domain-containing protein